jgi:hypothetical protein
MLGEIDSEFDVSARDANPAESVPFLHIERDAKGGLVLRADPTAEP